MLGVKDGPNTIETIHWMTFNPLSERLAHAKLIKIAKKTLPAFENNISLVPKHMYFGFWNVNRLNHDACKGLTTNPSSASEKCACVTAAILFHGWRPAPLYQRDPWVHWQDRAGAQAAPIPNPVPHDYSQFHSRWLFHGDRRQQPNAKVQMRTLWGRRQS